MSADLPKKQLLQVSPAAIRLYAVQSGWIPQDGVKRPVILLNHPTDDLAQIQIPLSGDERDFTFLMGEAVRSLASFEKRPALEVLADLVVPSADVVRFSVQSRDADADTLPLDEGLRILNNGRDLLLAAACSAHQPQAYFRSLSYGPAMDFIRSCRMGQTERGSYVATILAPVAPDLGPSLFDSVGPDAELETEPYERKVTLLLMSALQSLRSTLDRGRVDNLLRSLPAGVSANLCEALAQGVRTKSV